MARLLCFTFALLLLLSAVARADVIVQVDYGWDGVFRPGRWAPVFVTLTSTDKPRQVNIELYAPHDRTFAMGVRETTAVDTRPTTIRMYAPLAQTLDELSVAVRDAQTGRTLGDARVSGNVVGSTVRGPVWDKTVTGPKLCIGVSGAAPVPGLVHARNAGTDAGVGFIDPPRLPDAAIGYDSLDLLVLSSPDLLRLRPEQQDAIADWVRAGGKLVLWPGPDPIPPTAPLASILPAHVGPATPMHLPEATLHEYGLQSRFKQLAARALDPTADAIRVPLLNTPAATAYRHRVGFGQVLLLPFDASLPLLDDPHAEKFWAAVVGAITPLAPPPADRDQYNYGFQSDPRDARQDAALLAVMEVIGDVPGLGRFDFSYIAWSLVGLMLLVGPVDWFVLKRLGRQPWTWVTTGAWVVLMTAAAVLIGQAVREGKSHFSTLELVDEADGAAVATTTVSAVYAPRTDNYDLTVDKESWWEPTAPPENGYWGGRGARIDVPFHQTYAGNIPLPQRINIWNQRFMIGRTIAVAPGTITATLAEHDGHVTGSITNNAAVPLDAVAITTHTGRAKVSGTIAAKATVPVDLKLEPAPEPPTKVTRSTPYYYANENPTRIADYHEKLAWYASDLTGWRSEEVEARLAAGEIAWVQATVTPNPPSFQLTPQPDVESHVRLIRSIIPLTKAGQ